MRKIIEINEDKCNGCGLCISGCHEAALQLINGKAKLVSDNLCDGLGACLPECPTGAMTIVEREADAFDEFAVKQRIASINSPSFPPKGGCPGSMSREIRRESEFVPATGEPQQSQLRQWPCKLKLVPTSAPYFDNAHLLVAADCTAYAYANMHAEFMRNRITVTGCPKFDNINYADKLTEILQSHEVKSVTVVRMEVPCCVGIVSSVKEAIANSQKIIPWRIVIIGTDGNIRED